MSSWANLAPDDLRIPRTWEIIAGADTGTYMGGLIAAISPGYDLFALEEFPNYHYTGDGTIEELNITVSEWMRLFSQRMRHWTKKKRFGAWADANTTFKTEVGHGLRFRMNRKSLELRTEITREYVRRGRLFLAPWLTVLPYEMEEAKFPEHESYGSGTYRRLKTKDHILDCLEHIASRRPHPEFRVGESTKKSPIQRLVDMQRQGPRNAPRVDPHLGAE